MILCRKSDIGNSGDAENAYLLLMDKPVPDAVNFREESAAISRRKEMFHIAQSAEVVVFLVNKDFPANTDGGTP